MLLFAAALVITAYGSVAEADVYIRKNPSSSENNSRGSSGIYLRPHRDTDEKDQRGTTYYAPKRPSVNSVIMPPAAREKEEPSQSVQAPERDSAVDTDERYSSLQFSFQEPKNETEDPPCTEEDLALLAQYDKTFDLIYEDPALETAEAREAQALLDDPQAFSNIEDPMTRCVIAGLYEIDP